MLRQNTQTGGTKKDVPITKGCIIGFRKVDKKMVTISIESVDYMYYWGSDNNSDHKAIIYTPLSECGTVAKVISKAAGFQGVKLIKDTENLILFEVI